MDGASTDHFTSSTPIRREPWPGNAQGEAVFTRPTMARFILEDGDLPEIKEKASQALEQAGFPKTDRGKAEAVLAFARKVMHYVSDPPLRQTCVRPRYMLCARGTELCIRVGNCVNMNCALGALLRSVGFDVKVQGIEYGPGIQDHVNVLVLLRDERNTWAEADATTDAPVGRVSSGRKIVYDPHDPKVTGAGADKGVFIGAGRPFAAGADGWDDGPMSYAQAVTGRELQPSAPAPSGYASLFIGAGAGVQTQQFGGVTVVHVTDLGNGDAVQVPAQSPGSYLHVTVRGNETGLGSSPPTYKSHPGVNPDLSVSPTAIASVDGSRTGGQEFWFILNGQAGQIELDWQDVVLYQNNHPQYAPAIARVNVAGNAAQQAPPPPPTHGKVVLVPIPASQVASATKVKVVLVAIPSRSGKSSSTVGVLIPYDPTKNVSAPLGGTGASAGAGASIYTFMPGTCTRMVSTLAAGSGKLPPDALGNSAADMQAQYDSDTPGLYKVISVDYSADQSTVSIVVQYIGQQPYNVPSPMTTKDDSGAVLTTTFQTIDCPAPGWSTGKKVAVGVGAAAGAAALAGLIYWAAS